jgi:chromosome segregation ATPase
MKYLGPLLAGGLALVVVLIVGVFSFLPAERTSPPSQAESNLAPAPAAPDTGQLQAIATEREVAYQAQLEELNHLYQARERTYGEQLQALATQIATLQSQLDSLATQEQEAANQITDLEQTRTERLGTYQTQLEQAKAQYTERYTLLQAQLTEARTRLAEAKAQLGQ